MRGFFFAPAVAHRAERAIRSSPEKACVGNRLAVEPAPWLVILGILGVASRGDTDHPPRYGDDGVVRLRPASEAELDGGRGLPLQLAALTVLLLPELGHGVGEGLFRFEPRLDRVLRINPLAPLVPRSVPPELTFA